MTILVLALGNPLLGDEGAGIRALEALARTGELPASVELLDGGTSGLSLVPRVRAAERVLVVDTVRAGTKPGTVLRLTGAELARREFGKTSPHQLGLDDILSASRLGGGPEEVVVLGIEPESLALGVGLSAPVSKALDRLVTAALHQIHAWAGTRSAQNEKA